MRQVLLGCIRHWMGSKSLLMTQVRHACPFRVRLFLKLLTQGSFKSFHAKINAVSCTWFPELHLADSSISTVFIFDSVVKNLKKIQRGNATITIEYLQNRSSTFKHSSGGKITVKYNDKGLLREARLEEASGNEQRW